MLFLVAHGVSILRSVRSSAFKQRFYKKFNSSRLRMPVADRDIHVVRNVVYGKNVNITHWMNWGNDQSGQSISDLGIAYNFWYLAALCCVLVEARLSVSDLPHNTLYYSCSSFPFATANY